jgi:hypothetical protein
VPQPCYQGTLQATAGSTSAFPTASGLETTQTIGQLMAAAIFFFAFGFVDPTYTNH